MKTAPTYVPGPDEHALRKEVDAFVAEHMGPEIPLGLGMASSRSPEFSQAMAARGWLGMALPAPYGSDKGAVERWVIVEEMMARGAPMGAHWVADRQTALQLYRFGSDFLKEKFLPEIVAGRMYLSIGMSEPDSGSDLASVRTRAEKVPGGWQINGTKIWTSNAHVNPWAIVLVRTEPLGADRHQGLSQILVALDSPGVTVHPIHGMDDGHHFNMVTFEDVFVPDEMLVGEAGDGWKQVTSELVNERAGADRYMSCYLLLEHALAEHPEALARHAGRLGTLLARFATLRRMSQSIAAQMDEGLQPGVQVPLLKILGTTFEQDVVAFLREVIPGPLRRDHHASVGAELLTRGVLNAPTWTIRGGTVQILRNLVSRELAK